MGVRRLLAVTGGGGDFPAAPPTSVTLTTAPDGGWTQIPEARGIYANGVLYFTWTSGSSGAVRVQAQGGSPITLRTFTVDSHTTPALLHLNDDHLFIAYSDHVGATMYGRRSVDTLTTDPLLANGFDSEVTIAGSGQYTYPILCQLTDLTNDPVRCYMRSGSGGTTSMLMRQSTDLGVTWSFSETVWDANLGSYWKISDDGSQRVDFIVSDADPSAASSSIYHFYDDGAVYRNSGGTNIGASPHGPGTGPTEIYDSAEGPGWATDAKLYGGTTPVAVISIDNGSNTDSEFRYLRWNGSAWTEQTLVASVGVGVVDPAPVACLDDDDEDRIWLVRFISGTYELYEYGSAGSGSAVTSSSGSTKNIYPARIHGSGSLRVMYLTGTYTDFTDYDVGIVGRT